MSGIIDSILTLMGITAPPSSVAELVWFLVRIIIGLVVIRLVMMLIFGLIGKVGKW